MNKVMSEKDLSVVDEVIKNAERIYSKYSNEREKMSDENIPPLTGEGQKETPSGGVDNAGRIIDLMLELRKARETIIAQFNEIKTQVKSKISALKASEDALLDSLEERDQMTLFELDPEVSEEVKSIIADPSI